MTPDIFWLSLPSGAELKSSSNGISWLLSYAMRLPSGAQAPTTNPGCPLAPGPPLTRWMSVPSARAV